MTEGQRNSKKNKKDFAPSLLPPNKLLALINDSGLSQYAVYTGIGMDKDILNRACREECNSRLPDKWVAPILAFCKKHKAKMQDEKIEVKELLISNDIEVELIIPEAALPDIESKKEWISVLCKAKEEHDKKAANN